MIGVHIENSGSQCCNTKINVSNTVIKNDFPNILQHSPFWFLINALQAVFQKDPALRVLEVVFQHTSQNVSLMCIPILTHSSMEIPSPLSSGLIILSKIT